MLRASLPILCFAALRASVANGLSWTRGGAAAAAAAIPDPKRLRGREAPVSERLLDEVVAPLRDFAVSIVAYPPDEDVISRHLAQEGSWEPEAVMTMCELFRMYGGKGNFLDVGGNIGTWSIPMAKCLKDHGHGNNTVVTIEGLPRNARHLAASIQYNDLSNVHLYNYVVSTPQAGDSATFGDGKGNKGNSKITTIRTESSQTLPLTTIDAIAKSEGDVMKHVFAMKMDIEGHEEAAILGASAFFENGPCVVFSELNTIGEGNVKEHHYTMLEPMKKLGYVTLSIENGTGGRDGWFERADMKACLARFA